MGCNCGKPKCDGQCGCKSPAVLQINNPPEYITFHKVSVPAAMGDSTTNPPAIGKYKNVLLYYEADQTSWLYSTDGIPTKLTNGITNYEDAINLPQINGHTLLGNQSSSDLGLQGELTAGANIQINDNVISATDTTYTAGDGIEINSDNEISVKIGRGLEFNSDGEIDVSEEYIIGFDTVALMKNADNLIDGSYARTLGYYAKNDGGGALYKIRTITNEDVVDEGSIIAIGSGTLIAELIKSPKGVNVKQFGAKGDGLTDDYTAIQNAINSVDSGTVYFPVAKYIISHYLTPKANVNLKGGFSYKYYDTLDTGLCFSGTDGIYGNASISIEDLIIQNTSGELVNSGIKGKGFKINRCLITGFANAINANYGTAIIENCNIFGNGVGITQIVDSRVINNTINANNYSGIYLPSGSNDNIIANNKIEWNGGRGIQTYRSNDNVISNNVIDRNAISGIEINSGSINTVVGNVLRRNCVNVSSTSVRHAQIVLESTNHVVLSANVLRTGNSQDDGSGDSVPQYAVYVMTSSNVLSIGNDYSQGGTETPKVNTYNNGENVQFLDSGFELQKLLKGGEYNSGTISSGTSRTLTLPATLAYDNGLPQLDKFNYAIRRTDKGNYEAGEIDLSNFVLWGSASSTSAKISKDSFLSGNITATVTCDRTNSVYSLTLSTTDETHSYEVKLTAINI